ncbi:MAG: hypothetical protein AAF125_24405, partial [Chloroflexota bacterium]
MNRLRTRINYLILTYFAAMFTFILAHITRDPARTLATTRRRAPRGTPLETVTDHDQYRVVHVVENGIERISYYPRERKH